MSQSSRSSFRVWKRLKKDTIAWVSSIVILTVATTALFAYLIIPDQTSHANTMELSLAKLGPGSQVDGFEIHLSTASQEGFLYELLYGKSKQLNFVPVLEANVDGDFLKYTEYVLNGDPESLPDKKIELSKLKKQEEGWIRSRTFILGTDRFGRDYLSRLMLGARVSFSVGFISVLISILLGMSLGAAAAYFGGWVDKLIMWFINVMWSVPTLLMVIAITLALGKGFWQVFVAVGLTMWVEVARIVRGQVLGIRELEFVSASSALGYSHFRTIFKHIIPNTWGPVIVISAANFAAAILIESGLSFLGIGAQPPIPSWGGMIKDHYAYIIMDKAYLAIFPGLAIMILVLSFMLLGNSLRAALDVRDTG